MSKRKPIFWLGSEIKTPPFSEKARQEVGFLLGRVQEEDKMNSAQSKRLKNAGWKRGNAEDFLGMSPEETQLLRIKLQLAREIDLQRKRKGLTQSAMAEQLDMKQSNVSRIAKNPSNVTIDLLFKILMSLGNSPRKIAALI